MSAVKDLGVLQRTKIVREGPQEISETHRARCGAGFSCVHVSFKRGPLCTSVVSPCIGATSTDIRMTAKEAVFSSLSWALKTWGCSSPIEIHLFCFWAALSTFILGFSHRFTATAFNDLVPATNWRLLFNIKK